ncbi:MAG: IclR family transcriptional regulator [Candidatus Latescibacteria bacterium]|nr:IclR family transcriptional regulator [Candidatus Latescibacterota bacterium]
MFINDLQKLSEVLKNETLFSLLEQKRPFIDDRAFTRHLPPGSSKSGARPEILEAIKNERNLRLTELQKKLSLSKGTIHRYLSTLISRGYVVQNAKDRTYSLGVGAFQLASAVFDSHFLRESVQSPGRTARPQRRDGPPRGHRPRRSVYIDRIESAMPLRAKCDLGQREPLHTTALGKVLLAFRREEEIRALLTTANLPGFTRNTITNTDVLIQHLALVRQRGYAVDSEEHSLHLHSFAFPVRDRAGEVIAAVSIDGPSFRFTLERITTLAGSFSVLPN